MLARYIFGHSRYFTLIIICVLAVGIASVRSISRQEDPTLTNFVGSITTFYPGASPDRVEALVTRPLEDELRKIPEIDELSSTSTSGVSAITIRLYDDLPDEELERSWSEIRDAMTEASRQFPAGAGEPDFDNDRMSSFTAIVALSSAGAEDMPLSLLSRMAHDFADRARNLPNTKLAELFGEPQEEIRVEIDETALVARGLSLQQVATALQAADAKVSSGRASGAGTDMLIELAGDFDSMERIRQVILNTSSGGAATRIADIARVYRGAVTPPPTLALAQGRPAILVGVTMENGKQVDIWSESFRRLVSEFRQESAAGLNMEITYDQSRYAEARLAEVAKNLAMGIALVILVLLFTLGWRAAVVVAVILPLCGLISITVMERMGLALHQMSVSGLIVALGLLVDGSIVMTDEVRKRLLDGHSPLESITGSVHRLRIPLISSAVTTILAFMPMAIVAGPAGDFVGSIAKAVIIMLITSTVLALVITPVLAAWLLPRKSERAHHWYIGGAASGRAGAWLVRALDWSLRHPLAAIALSLSLPVSGFLVFPTLTAQFFPGTDRDQMYIQVKLADGRSIHDTRALVQQLDTRLRDDPLIRRVDWTLGESPPAFYYNMYRTREGIPSWAEALVLTRDKDQTNQLIRRLQVELDRDFPEARIVVRGIDQGPPVMAPLEVEIFGPNLEVLQALGEQFRLRVDSIPQVTHTTVDLIGGAPKLLFELEEEKLRLAQLQLTDAATALNDALLGRVGGEVLEGTERLPVRVRLAEQEWGTSERIADIRIPRPAQAGLPPSAMLAGLPLSALGKPRLLPAQSPISRQDGERLNRVSGFIKRGVLPEEALKVLREELERDPIALPQGYHAQFGGDSDARAEVMQRLIAPLGLILSALLATLVLTFNSWRLTAVSLVVCVCSLGLSLLSLAVFAYPFGIMAVIGVIGSIGVSINAAIIIITALQENEGAAKGGLFAIRAVVMDSSRHIISTTVTTFGGFLPLILEGSQFWPPFAMAIAGGVLLSTIVSFFLVPPAFLLVTRAGRKRERQSPGPGGYTAVQQG
ncbi:MAG: efflux RND transporter permease subunit [Halieaceae bacterium]|jgi:multidrug efflux pump subunit AcrB|nr:efflux RND transporter permease subunit [Halieaceae bacterium]